MSIRHPAAKRWRPRFSIGSLLMIMTIGALVVVLWQERRRHTEVKAELVSRLNSLGYRFNRLYLELPHPERYVARNVGRFEESLQLFETDHEEQKRYLGASHRSTVESGYYIGELNYLIGRFDEAEPYLVTYLESSPHHARRDFALACLAEIRIKQHRFSEAEALIREAITITRSQSTATWHLSSAESTLGECLVGQQRFAEAEPVLVGGYERLRAMEDTIWHVVRPKRISVAAQRLVDLYEQWGKTLAAEKWRHELERVAEKFKLNAEGTGAAPSGR